MSIQRPAAHPQIRLRFRSADAWIPLPDHPSTVSVSCVATPSLRVRACPAESSGCGRGGATSERPPNTGPPLIDDSPHSSPSMPRVHACHAPAHASCPSRSSWRLLSWSRAMLLKRHNDDTWRSQLTHHCSPPKKGAALTAVLEGEDVTVRGVRFRGPGRSRGGAGVIMAGKLYSATAPGPRIRLLRRASVLGTDGSGGTDSLDCTDAMSPRAFTGNRVRWDDGIVS
jgi:hypothetical protein